jgi:hypothetical protein
MADSSRLSPSLAALSAVTARRWKLGPARNRVGVERGVAVRMRDGAVLLADHYSPVVLRPAPRGQATPGRGHPCDVCTGITNVGPRTWWLICNGSAAAGSSLWGTSNGITWHPIGARWPSQS